MAITFPLLCFVACFIVVIIELNRQSETQPHSFNVLDGFTVRRLFDASRDSTVDDLEQLQSLYHLRQAAPKTNVITPCTDPQGIAEAEAILKEREAERKDPSRNLVGACVSARDEAHHLAEWVAFHYVSGVDLFLIMDDGSDDGIAEVLQPFTDAGFVQLITRAMRGVPPEHNNAIAGTTEQMAAVCNCYQRFVAMNTERRKDGQPLIGWIVQGDLDEYSFSLENSTLGKTLALYNDSACVRVSRVQYGGGTHLIRPPGLAIENYLQHAMPSTYPRNYLIPKCFGNLLAPPDVLPFPVEGLKSPHRGKTFLGDEFDPKCVDINPIDYIDRTPVEKLHGKMRMNHYAHSLEEHIMKIQFFWAPWHRKETPAHPSQWVERNANETESREILHWACATRKTLVDFNVHVPMPMGVLMPQHIDCLIDGKGKRFCLDKAG